MEPSANATVEHQFPGHGRGPLLTAKRASVLQGISLAMILVAVLLFMRALPLSEMQEFVTGWIEGLGMMGPVVFALIYVVATVLLIPGSVITLAGGAIFGLGIGFVAVSVGSVAGAAAAFLIARYLARTRVEEMARSRPKFAAIDEAISEGGWKIVVLLRLSPAIPFNVQNYLYGLTDIKFWPYVIASWLAMAPGTFLYVYLGHVAGAAATAGGGRSVAQWGMLAVGLLATVVVTVYVTRLAKRKLDEKTSLNCEPRKQEPASTATVDSPPSWGRTIRLGVTAVVLLAAAIFAQTQKQSIAQLLGSLVGALPPRVELTEAYAPSPDGPHVDHSLWDMVLKSSVREGGWVDYQAIKEHPEQLQAYLEVVAQAPFEELGRNEKLALLINAYNAFTVQLIVENYPVKSIRDIPGSERWEAERWQVGNHVWSLSQIEHEQIRPKFAEPRIHFALVCAAVGCPPLTREAYRAGDIGGQLQRQAEYVHHHQTWFQFEPENDAVMLTRLYQWYGSDFAQVAGSELKYAAQFSPALQAAIEREHLPRVQFMDYDWRLNDIANEQSR